MSSCLFAQFLPLFFYDLLLTISSRTHAEKHSIRYQPYFITRIDGTCDRRVRESHKDALVSSLRRHIGRIAPRAQLNGQILQSSVFPTISIFFFFLLPFHYRLFSAFAEEPRLLTIAAIHESTMKRPYDSAYVCDVLYKTR